VVLGVEADGADAGVVVSMVDEAELLPTLSMLVTM